MYLPTASSQQYGRCVAPKILRPYQSELKRRAVANISAEIASLVVLPTGAGKTALFSEILAEFDAPSVAIAHRRELVAQMSQGLASNGTFHEVIAPPATIRMIAAANANMFGCSFVEVGASAAVASVDSMKKVCPRWARSKKLAVIDEGHHGLPDNKWGKCLEMFENATLSGWTATPERADGRGLDGLFDEMIIGPTMRELIDQRYLSDYRIYAPPGAQIDMSQVPVSPTTGEFAPKAARETIKGAQITGDVVAHYKRLVLGQLALVFVSDVEAAEVMAQAFREAGVPAAAVSAKTKGLDRNRMVREFGRRELHVLVNVDLFGEGFDLSAAAGMDVCVDVVIMVRATNSFSLFAQQFGRCLRLPTPGIVIDHVGNVIRHQGPPDFPRRMSLAGRDKRCVGDGPAELRMRTCENCTGPYMRELSACPYCGHVWVPAGRSSPREVEGLLTELSPEVLAELRRQTQVAIMGDDAAKAHYSHKGLSPVIFNACVKRQRANRDAQLELRDQLGAVMGQWRADGAPDDVIYRRFWVEYGVDIGTACALKAKEAIELMARIK